MPAPSTSVRYFHSAMTGAPTLSGTAGSLISVLDTCLVNGFNVKTVDSIVVASGIATANISTGVGAFEADTVVNISGATPAGLNGDKRILSVTATAITFDATGIADQTASGTISAKLASAGWDKPFTGTNLAVYRSSDPTGTRFYLRVDDTGTQNARVLGYESMTDINTGVNPFPTAAQVSGGLYWPKANAANASVRPWTLIADGKTFWLHVHAVATGSGLAGGIVSFGDIAGFKSGDAYACAIHGATSDITTSTGSTNSASHTYNTSLTISGCYMARSYTGLGASVGMVRRAESYVWTDGHSGNYSPAVQYPNGPDNSLVFSRLMLAEAIASSAAAMRGAARGLLLSAQSCSNLFGWRDKLDGQGAYAGRKLLAIRGGGDYGQSPAPGITTNGVVFFDITGPWA